MSAIRRMMMRSKNKMLPYDAEVEYLESSGAQYIDTGVSVNSSLRLEVEFNISSFGVEGLIGGRVAARSASHALVFPTDVHSIRYDRGTGRNYVFATPYDWSLNKWHKVVAEGDDWWFDGVKQSSPAYSSREFTKNFSYYLFAINTNGAVSNLGAKKIHRCIISDGDNKLVDMIAVRVGQVGYMYDKLSGELFGNAGSGDFIVGNDV